MGKLAYFSIILIALTVSGGLLFVTNVKAETIVNRPITTDTTWTRANSPYTLTNDVAIRNVTLTIESGVTMNIGSHQLWVYGILNAQGTTDRIFFLGDSGLIVLSSTTGWDEQVGYGCIIDNAYFSSTTMIINGGSQK